MPTERRRGTKSAAASYPDVAGIETARDGRISGAFDDGAAIGKNSELVGIDAGADREIVGADGRERRQAAGQIGQIHGTKALVNLDRVAAAQADGRAALSRKMDEIAAGAAGAIGIAGRRRS